MKRILTAAVLGLNLAAVLPASAAPASQSQRIKHAASFADDKAEAAFNSPTPPGPTPATIRA